MGTPEECAHFKSQIMNQIQSAKIKIYEFPDVSDGEESEKKDNKRMKERVPFAVVGSNMVIDIDGKKCRGRKLAGVTGTDKVPNKNPLFMMEEEQKEHVAK